MSAFLTPLVIEKVGPQRWQLLADLCFASDVHKAVFVVPAGYCTRP